MDDKLNNVMDVTTEDLDTIFGKNEDSEDDFQVDPPQMAADNSPDEYDLMEDELKDFIKEQRNKNMTKNTDLCVKRFKEWLILTHNVKHTNLEKFQRKLLNLYIGGFILGLKKKDGTSFEPDTKTRTGGGWTVGLLGLRCSLLVGTGVQSICTSSMSHIGLPL